jgi:hypothetical protein
VGDGEVAVQRLFAQRREQLLELAHAFAHRDAVAVEDGDAGRIVPAVLQSAERVQHGGDHRRLADVSNDAAHR